MFASKPSRFQLFNLSLQDFILLFGILVILLTFTAQDVQAAVGALCDPSAPNCTEPGETCSHGSICVCGPGYYELNRICENKLNNGSNCESGGPQDQCVGNLICVAARTCGCRDDQYYDPTDVSCKTKLGHRTECNASLSDVCQESTTHCVPDKNGQTRCLCDSNSYYYSSSSSCFPLANIKVSDISHSAVTTDSVTLTWRANNYMSPITYEIQAVPSEGETVPGSVTGSRTGGTVTGLTPGTQYIFNVTSVIRADSYYPEKRVSVQSSPGVWTKINYSGTCEPNTQPSNLCKDANTACISSVSRGYRCLCTTAYYRNNNIGFGTCRQLNELKVSVSSIQASERLTNNVTLTWPQNSYGAHVSYRIQPSPSGSTATVLVGTKVTVIGLNAGTQHTFTVTPYFPADNLYREKTVDSTNKSGVWTKPAKPGTVTNVKLVSEQLVTYDITFGASQGQVSYYRISVNSKTVQSTGSSTTVTVPSLLPGQSYTYTITAYNGNGDPSENSSGTLQTPVIASGPVSDLTVKEITYSGATVTWKKPDRPNGEITGYILTVTEGSTCVYGYTISCSGCSIQAGTTGSITSCQNTNRVSKTSAALNSDSTTFTVDVSDLEPYHDYTVRVTAQNTEGTGAADNAIFRTLATTSGPVSDLTVKRITHSGATVTWKKPDRPNGDIIGYTLTVTEGSTCVYGHITYCPGCPITGSITSCQEKGLEVKTSAALNDDTTTFTVQVSDLKPYRSYTVTVTADNTEGTGAADDTSFMTSAATPSFEETLLTYRVTSLIRKPESPRSLEKAIDIVLCASCLLDDKQGKVERLGLIVCKVGTDGQCLNQVRRKRSVTDFDKFATWSSASQSEFQQAFRATSDAWMLSLKDDNNSYPFTIGNNESCSTLPNTTYCNGPLPENSGFRVAAIKCNAADCLLGPFEGPFTTQTQTSNDDVGLKAGLGVGITLLVIFIIVLIVLGVLWYRRKSVVKKEDRPYNEMDLAPRDSHDYEGMPEAASTDPKRNEQIWMAGLNKNLPSVKRNNGIGHDEEDHYDTVIENQDDESVAVNNEENPYRNKPKEESPYKNTSNVESPYKNSQKAEPPYVNSPKEEPPYSNSPKKKSPFKNSPKKRNQNNNVKIAGATNDYENLPL